MEDLQRLGVVYWKVNGENDPKLQAIRDVRGYSYKACCAARPKFHRMMCCSVCSLRLHFALLAGCHHGVA